MGSRLFEGPSTASATRWSWSAGADCIGSMSTPTIRTPRRRRGETGHATSTSPTSTTEAGKRILYTTDPADALAQVRSGLAQAAFLVRAPRLDDLAAVATAGDVMPEKATYFHPKLLTGMVFYPLEDE